MTIMKTISTVTTNIRKHRISLALFEIFNSQIQENDTVEEVWENRNKHHTMKHKENGI